MSVIHGENTSKHSIFTNPMPLEERLGFRVYQFPLDISFVALSSAIARVNSCWQKIEGCDLITNEKAIIAIDKGICRGSVEALFDLCAEGLSFEEAAQAIALNKEEVYFRHLFPGINLLDLMKINYKNKHEKLSQKIDIEKNLRILLNEEINKKRSEMQEDPKEIQKLIDLLIESKKLDNDLEIHEEELEDLTSKLNGTQSVIEEIQKDGMRNYNSRYKERKEQCNCDDSLSEYKKVMDNAVSDLPADNITRGIIETPEHTMGFEHGPEGFYLFDTALEAGLYRFPDRATFDRALQSFVHTSI